jgi:tRNA threonylcarbamoyl adenosine modification protein YjeE
MAQKFLFDKRVSSLAGTADIAGQIANLMRPGDIIALGGTLGAGKTAVARAIIRHLAQEDIDVPSPTYNLLLTYDFDDFCLYHYDLYRLESPEEALELDIDEAFDMGVSLIEWPDRLGGYLPEEYLLIEIIAEEEDDGEARLFRFSGNEDWRSRLASLSEGKDA